MSFKYEPASEPLHISVKYLDNVALPDGLLLAVESDSSLGTLLRLRVRGPHGPHLPMVVQYLRRGTSLIRNSAPLG